MPLTSGLLRQVLRDRRRRRRRVHLARRHRHAHRGRRRPSSTCGSSWRCTCRSRRPASPARSRCPSRPGWPSRCRLAVTIGIGVFPGVLSDVTKDATPALVLEPVDRARRPRRRRPLTHRRPEVRGRCKGSGPASVEGAWPALRTLSRPARPAHRPARRGRARRPGAVDRRGDDGARRHRGAERGRPARRRPRRPPRRPRTTSTAPSTTTTAPPPTTTTTTPPAPPRTAPSSTGEEGDEIAALQARLERARLLARRVRRPVRPAHAPGRDGLPEGRGPRAATAWPARPPSPPSPPPPARRPASPPAPTSRSTSRARSSWWSRAARPSGCSTRRRATARPTPRRGVAPPWPPPRRAASRSTARSTGSARPPRHPVPPEVLRRRHRHPRVRLDPGRAGVARLRPRHQRGHGPALVVRASPVIGTPVLAY